MIRSQRSPYGTSLLGAGAVHHIRLGRGGISVLSPFYPNGLMHRSKRCARVAMLHSITSSARASHRPQFRQCSPCPFVSDRSQMPARLR